MNDLASTIRRQREASVEASPMRDALLEICAKVRAWSADSSIMAAAMLAEVGVIAAAGIAADEITRRDGGQ